MRVFLLKTCSPCSFVVVAVVVVAIVVVDAVVVAVAIVVVVVIFVVRQFTHLILLASCLAGLGISNVSKKSTNLLKGSKSSSSSSRTSIFE